MSRGSRRRPTASSTAIRSSTISSRPSAATPSPATTFRCGSRAPRRARCCWSPRRRQWKVPVGELTTEPGMVVHAKSNRKYRLRRSRQDREGVRPSAGGGPRRNSSRSRLFRLIGKDVERVDGAFEGQRHRAIWHRRAIAGDALRNFALYPEVQHEKPGHIDDDGRESGQGRGQDRAAAGWRRRDRRDRRGAMPPKTLLKVTWTKASPGQTYNEDGVLADYRAIAADWSKPGIEMVKKGDADAALKGAAKVMTAEYSSEHVSHVCMEPLNATVQVDGDKVEVWYGNQAPRGHADPGLDRRRHDAGQGQRPHPVTGRRLRPAFGWRRRAARRDAREGHPRPSGEDDLEPAGRHAERQVPPVDAQRIEIGLDAKGDIVGWRHRIVNETYLGRVSRRRCSRRSASTTWCPAAAAR